MICVWSSSVGGSRDATARWQWGEERWSVSSDRGVDVVQQVARVNVTDEQWKEFRRACLDDDVAVSDALGRLVETELRRRRQRPVEATPSRRPGVRIDEPRLFG